MTAARLTEFLRFCLVGFIGFFADAALLELLVRAGLNTPCARVISLCCAMQVTYVLHDRFTFRHAVREARRRTWLTFMLANFTGALINYATFMLVLAQDAIADAMLSRQVALICGTAIALGFNYWANSRFVFAAKEH
ncbi:MAG: GtrA family protein [Pseudomonadota bacterium]